MYNLYKSKRHHLSQYFSDVLVIEIQKYLLPSKIINREKVFQDILLFYNFKRYLMKKGYFIKDYIKNFNKKSQINSNTTYNFYKKYCLRHNQINKKCPPSCYAFINITAINYNFLRISDGIGGFGVFDGLSYSC